VVSSILKNFFFTFFVGVERDAIWTAVWLVWKLALEHWKDDELARNGCCWWKYKPACCSFYFGNFTT